MSTVAQGPVVTDRGAALRLVGEGGVLTDLVRQVLQAGLELEMAVHLGYQRHRGIRSCPGNARNGSYPKTVMTEIGPVRLTVPRDRAGTFQPATVPKYVRRSYGLAAQVLHLCSKGLSRAEMHDQLAGIWPTGGPQDATPRFAGALLGTVLSWQSRPLVNGYRTLLLDEVDLQTASVRAGRVLVVVGAPVDEVPEVLGLWLGPSDGVTTAWPAVVGELRDRGVVDPLLVCHDGGRELTSTIRAVWPGASVTPGAPRFGRHVPRSINGGLVATQ